MVIPVGTSVQTNLMLIMAQPVVISIVCVLVVMAILTLVEKGRAFVPLMVMKRVVVSLIVRITVIHSLLHNLQPL